MAGETCQVFGNLTGLARPRLPYLAGLYQPSWVEWSMTAACFAALALLYLVFARLFPVLPIWEIREGEEKVVARPVRFSET